MSICKLFLLKKLVKNYLKTLKKISSKWSLGSITVFGPLKKFDKFLNFLCLSKYLKKSQSFISWLFGQFLRHFGSVCKNCHFYSIATLQVIFQFYVHLKKLLTYSNDYYKVIIMILESCLRLRLLLEESKFLKVVILNGSSHRPCPCSLWCGMSWNSHHHTWLYHHQGCSITTTRVWNDTSKIDICHPQMGAIMGSSTLEVALLGEGH